MSSSICPWDPAIENTTTLKFETPTGDEYLATCKECKAVVPNSPTTHRQLIGNCYQSITVCDKCSKTFVLNWHQNYDFFLETNTRYVQI